MAKRLPKAFLKRLEAVTGRRSRIVVDHILKHGYITTDDLKDIYGYDHPPRAVRDVKDQGIPVETYRVVGKRGKRIAAYRFADPADIRGGRHGGRRVFSKKFKDELISLHELRCAICSCDFERRYLQIDHRVPYEVSGDTRGVPHAVDFMLICGSCNRAKSWSCEHCRNWTTDHYSKVCKTCYWVRPEKYVHIALKMVRRLDVVWTEEEVPDFDKLLQMSKDASEALPKFVKDVLRRHTKKV